jgi:DNA gyrase subunit A
MPIKGIPEQGRNTQGVRLVRVDEGERVLAIESLAEKDEEAGEVQAGPVEVLEGEEDLSGEDAGDEGRDDDTVEVETETGDDEE